MREGDQRWSSIVIALALLAYAPGWIAPPATAAVPQITSFTAKPASIRVGETTTLAVNISPFDRAYDVAIVDSSTGSVIARCWAMFSPCTREVTVYWEEAPYPRDLHFTAEVLEEREPATGGGIALEVPVDPRYFNLDLSFGSPGTNPLGEPTWEARATASPQLYGTPYNLWIKSLSGA
ncbi:MAG TPA: hypothetical protein VNM41_00555, partial [Solirubrobacterales bacterium]|nr:hypothetical protein [Solirubrobacterales bacterium]